MSIDNGQPGGIPPQEASVSHPLVLSPQRYNRLLTMDDDAKARRQTRRIQSNIEIDRPTTVELGYLGSEITILPSKTPGKGAILTDHEIRPLGPRNALGRTQDNNIQFQDVSVSREHARLDQWRGWKLADRNSSNGTFVEPVKSLHKLREDNGTRRLPLGEWVSTSLQSLTIQLPDKPLQVRERVAGSGQYSVHMEGESWKPLSEGTVVTVGSNQDTDPALGVRDTINLPRFKFPSGGQVSIALYEGQVYLGNFSSNPISVEDPHRAQTTPLNPDRHRADTLPLATPDQTHHAGTTPGHRGRRLGIHFPDLKGLFGKQDNDSAEKDSGQEIEVKKYDVAGSSIAKDPSRPDLNQDGMVMLEKGGFIAAIDGMGGHSITLPDGTEINGRNAMKTLQPIIAREMMTLNAKGTITEDDVERAYHTILKKGKAAMPAYVGATLAMAQPVGETLVCGSAGDAEIGIVNTIDGTIRYVTPREGGLRGVVTNAITATKGEMRITKAPLRKGDKYAIAISDGFKKHQYHSVQSRLIDYARSGLGTSKTAVDATMSYFLGVAPDDATLAVTDLQSAR